MALLLAVGAMAGCGNGDDGGEGAADTTTSTTAVTTTEDTTTSSTAAPVTCGDDEQEPVDPNSLLHVLPGAAEPAYTSDPPTSGPHAPGVVRSGSAEQPLSRPEQVGQLEAGGVLIQYRDLAIEAVADLADLADGGADVFVAPNPDLPDLVVATAWTHKLRCTAVDDQSLAALRTFITEHAGAGPGSDG